MFKLPEPPRFCELMDAESCLTADGTDAWAEAKEEGTALFKAGEWSAAAAKYVEAESRALSNQWRVRPLLCGCLHARSTSPLRILGSGEPALLEKIIELVLEQSYEKRFAARMDVVARPLGRRDSTGRRAGKYVPTGARADHPEGYPLRRYSEKLLYFDAATGGAILTELGQPEGLTLPNKNAAIAASNAAAAYLKLDDAEKALRCGLRAVSYCPEYPKAHHRVVAAVKAGARGGFGHSDAKQGGVKDHLAMFREIKKAQAEGLAAVLPPSDGNAEEAERARKERMQTLQGVMDDLPEDFDVDDEIAKYEELEKELSAGFLTSESIVAHLMASAEEIEQWCEKTPFVSNLCVKTIILPRQARDKQT
jgi:hypothetical protein